MRVDPHWLHLALSTPLEADQVRAVLTALCALSGGPIITLEARGAGHEVTWRVGTSQKDTARVTDLLRAHLPRLHVSPPDEVSASTLDAAARLGFLGSPRRSLAGDDPEPATRTVLGALARARKGERVVLQVTLGPRRRPSFAVDRGERDHKLAAIKWREPRYQVDIRVAATAADPARTQSLINSVVASIRSLEAPGVRLVATKTSIDGFSQVSLPWWWRSHLTPSELVPLTAYPMGTSPLPGVPSPHPRRLYADRMIPRTGTILGHAPSDGAPRPVALKRGDSARHLLLLGPSGVGKSTLLGRLCLADLEAGRGLALIDPKGDLVEEVLQRIPENRRDDVVVLDPRDDSAVGLASLQGDPDRTADALLAVFHSLYADSWGVRSPQIIHAALLTLARRGDASLVMMPTLLTNPGFRRSVVGRLVKQDPMGLGAFWGWYEALSDGERQQAIAPVMTRLQPILLRPGMRHVLGQRTPRFELADIFTKNRILLVSLSKGQLGSEAAKLLGSILVSLLWDAAQARAGVGHEHRAQTSIYIDEVADYLRIGDLGDALVQARGLGVGFTLAHQHLAQLPPALREAVLANVQSRVMFRLSHNDARDLAKMSRGQVEAEDLESLQAYEAYASLLVDGNAAPWVSLHTEPLGPALHPAAEIRRRSQERYGVSAAEIDADLLGLIEPPARASERFGRTPRTPGEPS